jgi:hypothetical protein
LPLVNGRLQAAAFKPAGADRQRRHSERTPYPRATRDNPCAPATLPLAIRRSGHPQRWHHTSSSLFALVPPELGNNPALSGGAFRAPPPLRSIDPNNPLRQGCNAALLKVFRCEARFPESRQEVPSASLSAGPYFAPGDANVFARPYCTG